VNRAERRERLQPVMHALAAVTLLAQGFGNIDDPSSPRLLVVLPFIAGRPGGGQRGEASAAPPTVALVDLVSGIIEGATCALVGIAAARRGTGYVQLRLVSLPPSLYIGAAIRKSRRARVA
jgi:hypothetical protein